MLIKETLEKKIEKSIESAMKEALLATFPQRNVSDSNQIIAKTPEQIAECFAREAKTCASSIADAIDEYIKSMTITINSGTVISPLPGLVSPTGPVTGVITLASPTILTRAIS